MMKIYCLITWISVGLAGANLAIAADANNPGPALTSQTSSADANAGKNNKIASHVRMPEYRPPKRGAPAARVGGGTRGFDKEMPNLYVLAPDHVGLTGQEQPVLNWYMSKPAKMQFEFSLIDENGIEPILEVTLGAEQLKAGIQGLSLADYGIRLKPGVQYQWSVALVPDAGKRSSDILASGMIERRNLSADMTSRLSKAGEQEGVFIFAEEGYWYDAVSRLSGLIETNPDSALLKQQRAELLKQAGLPGGLEN